MPENLLPNPTANPATLLPEEPEVTAALAADAPVSSVVVSHPSSSLAWALLADEAWERGATLESYAYARVGYHRGLDALRKAGWRGAGPVPWSHEPNRGVLRALFALRRAAEAIEEPGEPERLTDFLDQSDPEALRALSAGPVARGRPRGPGSRTTKPGHGWFDVASVVQFCPNPPEPGCRAPSPSPCGPARRPTRAPRSTRTPAATAGAPAARRARTPATPARAAPRRGTGTCGPASAARTGASPSRSAARSTATA